MNIRPDKKTPNLIRSPRAIMVATVATALVLTGCATGQTTPTSTDDGLEAMDPIVLTYSDSSVDTAAHAVAMKGFMERVTEATDGAITFETYFSGTLHSVSEAVTALESGLTDIAFMSARATPDSLPITAWEVEIAQDAIPAGFPTSLTTGTPVQFALYQDGPIADELASHDIAPLATWTSVPYPMLCKPAVESAADLQGKTSFTGGPTDRAEIAALGMTPVSLPIADAYEGLQRGVVDCIPNVVSSLMTLSLWDEAKHFIPANFAMSGGLGLFFKKSVLESLPLEAQRVIFDEQAKLLADIVSTTLERNVQWSEEAEAKGIVWVDPADVNEQITAARAEYVADAIQNPPTAQLDADAVVAALDEHVANWESVSEGLAFEAGAPETAQGWIDLYASVGTADWAAYEEALREYLAPFRP